MTTWLLTFTITVIIEIVIGWPVLGLGTRAPRLRLIFLANLATHPIVFALTSIPSRAPTQLLLVAVLELGATACEAWLYSRVLGREITPLAIAASCMANAGSLFASFILFAPRTLSP